MAVHAVRQRPNGLILLNAFASTSAGDQRPITADSMYLLDSGAQYLDGTTDVTRTMHFGTPSAKQKECFTRALKGHLALSNCVFPDHVTGQQLDVLARSALWQAGLDYNHGTGYAPCAAEGVHVHGPLSATHCEQRRRRY